MLRGTKWANLAAIRGQVNRSATPPLGIVSLLLTPQVPRRKIPATFLFAARSSKTQGDRNGKALRDSSAGVGLTFTRNTPIQSEREARVVKGDKVQYLPGWTVQCINPECAARGHWLRVDTSGGEICSNCSAPLRNVPPPLAPRMRMRPRSLGSYRPSGRPSGRPR
jgi:hypothetical protein